MMRQAIAGDIAVCGILAATAISKLVEGRWGFAIYYGVLLIGWLMFRRMMIRFENKITAASQAHEEMPKQDNNNRGEPDGNIDGNI